MKKIFTLFLLSMFLLSCGTTKKLSITEYNSEIKKINEKTADELKKLQDTLKNDASKDEKSKFVKDFSNIINKNYNEIISLKGPDSLKEEEKEFDSVLKKISSFYKDNQDELIKSVNGEKTSDEFTKKTTEFSASVSKLSEIQTKIEEKASENKEETPKDKK